MLVIYIGPPLYSHKEKAQVVLDVNRCGRRLPKGFCFFNVFVDSKSACFCPSELDETNRTILQNQLTRVILRLLATHNELCYYQGLHDVTLTVLLVMEDEDITFAIMENLVKYHLR